MEGNIWENRETFNAGVYIPIYNLVFISRYSPYSLSLTESTHVTKQL